MNKCNETEIQELLPDLAHGSLEGRERQRVEAHLATCESCREDLDVIRMVKSAAVFAPTIDVAGVVRQIPPYRTILPVVEKPARTKMVQWLVAAAVLVAVVGGGSAILTNQLRNRAQPVAGVAPESIKVLTPTPKAPEKGSTVPRPSVTAVASQAQPQVLALSTDLADLSDGNLVQLMNDMDQFDALPAVELDPVIAVDSVDSL